MEASGTTPAAEGGEQTPRAPAAPEGGQPAEGGPDFSEQLRDFGARLEAMEGRSTQGPGSLAEGLAGGEEGYLQGLSDEELLSLYSEGGPDLEQAAMTQQVGPDLSDLDSYVQQRIDAAITPLMQQREDEKLAALQDKYPDIMEPEIFAKVETYLGGFVQRYGNEGLKTDPGLVEMAYKAVKADAAAANETPAEQAAQEGATLETNAGSTQTGEPSLEDKYAEAMAATRSGGDAFT